MDSEIVLTVAGLLLDIAGVTLLFLTTSIGKIEEEISLQILEGVNEFSESQPIRHEERVRDQNDLITLRQKVRGNRRRQRTGLALVIVGFGLQCVGVLSPFMINLVRQASYIWQSLP